VRCKKLSKDRNAHVVLSKERYSHGLYDAWDSGRGNDPFYNVNYRVKELAHELSLEDTEKEK